MRAPQITHLLLDLDGTLTDPQEGIIGSIQYALQQAGKSAPKHEELLWCIGPPLHDSFAALVPEASTEQIKELVAHYRVRFKATGMFENEVYPGIPELLNELQTRFSLFLCTSKPHAFANPILEHFRLNQYFTKIYGSELDGTRSDKAHLIAHILKENKLNPNHAVMIGDRKHDVVGAKKNGMEAIGVSWGYGSREELSLAGAGRITSSPKELEKILLQ
jgi:phosphoglycolate phosphatase